MIDKITDTLGREIIFNYDVNLHLQSITQSWQGQTFTWADESYGQVTDPDCVAHKEIFGTTGGTRGLATRMETRHNNVLQKFTDLTWVSDNSLSPPLRLRVTDAKTCDDRNHDGDYDSGSDKLSRTTIEYIDIGTVRLPWIVREYNEGGQSVLRSTRTDYFANSNYTNRRIIGLPCFTYLYEGDQATLVAQSEYIYDSANESGTTFLQAHAAAPRQHDATYGTGFTYRGNLTKARRYSVIGGVASAPIETKTGYYTTGTTAFAKDPLDHQTSFFYDDSFLHYTETSPGVLSAATITQNPPTYAYPTKVTSPPETDYPSGVSSTASYNYHFGAITRIVDPKAYAASPQNPQTMSISTYDDKGRLDKALVWKDGAKYSQTRNVYGTDHNWVQTWATVNSLSEETAVLHLLDGVSRERVVVNEHPGSQGGLSSYYRVFERL